MYLKKYNYSQKINLVFYFNTCEFENQKLIKINKKIPRKNINLQLFRYKSNFEFTK